MASEDIEKRNEDDIALFGDIPEEKKRKFILVEDTQKAARVRVKVTLDQIETDDLPDSYRKRSAVFPRAYYPVTMQSNDQPTRENRYAEEGEEVNGGAPVMGKCLVPVKLGDGEFEVDVAQISRSKRGREQKINELGYRMAWGQSRVFADRPIFLARARESALLAG